MSPTNWKKELCTVPNLLSLLRLILVPVYAGIYLRGQYLLAGGIMAVSCLTDLLDGFIARRWNMITNLGKVLDPLADKVTQLTITLCLCRKHPQLLPVLALLVVKECFQLTLGVLYLRRGRMLDGALPEGKVCTAIFFLSLLTLVLFPGVSSGAVQAVAASNGFLLTVSLLGYAKAYREMHVK